MSRDPIELSESLSSNKAESDNAILLFEGVGQIDRVNAALPGLWTYMAFNTCRQYMLDRWSLTNVRSWKRRVRDRWILPNVPSRGRLVRHGIARLWWITELTYDGSFEHELSKNTNDQYAYTKWTFEVENRIIQLFDRSVGDDANVLWAVMDSMRNDESAGASDRIADVGRDVLLEMSTRQLGMMNQSELRTFIDTIREQTETTK